MTAYPDDFNRPDGPLGAAWTVLGAASIVSNACYVAGQGRVIAAGHTEATDQDHYIIVPITGGTVPHVGVMLKYEPSMPSWYFAEITMSDGDLAVMTGYQEAASHTHEHTTVIPMPASTSLTLRGVYDAATMTTTAYVNGVAQAETVNGSFGAYSGFGFAFINDGGTLNAFDDPDVPPTTPKSVTDDIALSDTVAVAGRPPTIADAITATDAILVWQMPTPDDEASASDAVAITAEVPLADAILATDEIAVSWMIEVADTTTVTDDLEPTTVYVERNEWVTTTDDVEVMGRRAIHGHSHSLHPIRRTSTRNNG